MTARDVSILGTDSVHPGTPPDAARELLATFYDPNDRRLKEFGESLGHPILDGGRWYMVDEIKLCGMFEEDHYVEVYGTRVVLSEESLAAAKKRFVEQFGKEE